MYIEQEIKSGERLIVGEDGGGEGKRYESRSIPIVFPISVFQL